MPIENELKFVVRLDDKIEEQAKKLGKCLKIRQGYIADDKRTRVTVRLRQIEYPNGKIGRFLQTKCKFDRSSTTEIGAPIDESDFKRLWKLAKGKLTKCRYCIEAGSAKHREVWELDFFKNKSGNNFFVLAEIEIPEFEKLWRSPMPKLIEDNIVYSVVGNDTRFSNRKLGNIKYATDLYRYILHKEK